MSRNFVNCVNFENVKKAVNELIKACRKIAGVSDNLNDDIQKCRKTLSNIEE